MYWKSQRKPKSHLICLIELYLENNRKCLGDENERMFDKGAENVWINKFALKTIIYQPDNSKAYVLHASACVFGCARAPVIKCLWWQQSKKTKENFCECLSACSLVWSLSHQHQITYTYANARKHKRPNGTLQKILSRFDQCGTITA